MAVSASVPEQIEALNLGKKRTSNNNNSEEDEDGNGDENEEVSLAPSAAKRIKTERYSPPVSCSSEDEMAAAQAAPGDGCPLLTVADVVRYSSDSRRCSPSSVDEDVVEMDINTSPSTGQYIIYRFGVATEPPAPHHKITNPNTKRFTEPSTTTHHTPYYGSRPESTVTKLL